jgi:hypothetical protein
LKNLKCIFLNAKDTSNYNQLWQTGKTSNSGDKTYRIVMQTDNNLVIYDSVNSAIWDTSTYDKGYIDCFIQINNNGNLAMHQSDGSIVWQTNTVISIKFKKKI